VTEARLEDHGSGLAPSSEGWFVVNVRDAGWLTFGASSRAGTPRLAGRPVRDPHGGARTDDEQLLYPVSDLAGRHGASAEKETPDPQQAHAPFERPRPGKPSYWHQLPWA
jgi:hypothetical protein